MKISFITTIYNEEKTIEKFFFSLAVQTRFPDEIIIVDGGSLDNTLTIISQFKFPSSVNKVKVITKKGNRSVGRNEAIRTASGSIIVCSDAGNMLDKKWIENIIKPFSNNDIDVVAGYYKGIAKNVFQKCVIPYALVMPDKVNPTNFLPATRSIAFRKDIWKKMNGFDEKLSHNEDYAFAKKLKKNKAKIVFEKDAIVYWIPRSTLKDAYIMFLRFAYGDAEAKIFRPKVLLIFLRYIIAIFILISAIIMQSEILFLILVIGFFLYSAWAVNKNYKYINHWQAIIFLPLLQITADVAVIVGTSEGIFRLWDMQKTQ